MLRFCHRFTRRAKEKEKYRFFMNQKNDKERKNEKKPLLLLKAFSLIRLQNITK